MQAKPFAFDFAEGTGTGTDFFFFETGNKVTPLVCREKQPSLPLPWRKRTQHPLGFSESIDRCADKAQQATKAKPEYWLHFVP